MWTFGLVFTFCNFFNAFVSCSPYPFPKKSNVDDAVQETLDEDDELHDFTFILRALQPKKKFKGFIAVIASSLVIDEVLLVREDDNDEDTDDASDHEANGQR